VLDPQGDDDLSADEYYNVEAVLKERTTSSGRAEFWVQWEGYGPKDNTWVGEGDIHGDVVAAFRRRQSQILGGLSGRAGQIQGGASGRDRRGNGIQGGGSGRANLAAAAASKRRAARPDYSIYLTPAELDASIGHGATLAGWSAIRSRVNGRVKLKIHDPEGHTYRSLEAASQHFQAGDGVPQPETRRVLSCAAVDAELGIGAYDSGWRGAVHRSISNVRLRVEFQTPAGKQIECAREARAVFDSEKDLLQEEDDNQIFLLEAQVRFASQNRFILNSLVVLLKMPTA
jgi:hypothetical protein